MELLLWEEGKEQIWEFPVKTLGGQLKTESVGVQIEPQKNEEVVSLHNTQVIF